MEKLLRYSYYATWSSLPKVFNMKLLMFMLAMLSTMIWADDPKKGPSGISVKGLSFSKEEAQDLADLEMMHSVANTGQKLVLRCAPLARITELFPKTLKKGEKLSPEVVERIAKENLDIDPPDWGDLVDASIALKKIELLKAKKICSERAAIMVTKPKNRAFWNAMVERYDFLLKNLD